MKIAICYPPLDSPKGTPLLSQNRQFQWFSDPLTAYAIYPVVMASAATLLKYNGYEVTWLDGIAEHWNYQKFEEELIRHAPDLVVMETKTPVVKEHWKIIDKIKMLAKREGGSIGRFAPRQARGSAPSRMTEMRCVLVGDHVTALPEESMQKSSVDYILTGGDYDFLLLNLCNHLAKGEKLECGIWHRENNSRIEANEPRILANTANNDNVGNYFNTGQFVLQHNLNSLPMIDRELTNWKSYAYKITNFRRKPGAYTMFGRDCWHGVCTFCSWTTLYPGSAYRVVSVSKALDEVGHLIDIGVREIMDDSGTFPVGPWLGEFCQGMIKRGYNKKLQIDCNMRFNAGLSQEDYNLMAKAGFRFILYGLESASQITLDRINKNLKVEMVEENLEKAVNAGLYPHITIMVGYPWETRGDVAQTLNMARDLFHRGLVDSMQATIVIPYPGTPLFEECKRNNWLKTLDWDDYDMRQAVMKTDMTDEEIKTAVQSLYKSFLTPSFFWRKIKSIRDLDDIKYYAENGLKFIGKLMDFRR